MAFTAETGDHKVTRSDIFLVDPTALVVDWKKNLSRNGEEPPVDDALIELARDMMPKKGQGDGEDGTSGQLNPILTRPLPDRRLEVVGGFRRMRAALWLIESGTCPDFKVKYIVSRLSDAEAALVNLSENMQREDPKPIQLAHAVRSLTEDYGLTLKQVAGRLKRSESWLNNLLNLVMLPVGYPGAAWPAGRPRSPPPSNWSSSRPTSRSPCSTPWRRAARRSPPPRSRRSARRSTRRPARAARSPGRSSSSGRSWKARPAPPTPATGSPPTCWTTSPGSDRTRPGKYWDRAFAEPAGTRMTG